MSWAGNIIITPQYVRRGAADPEARIKTLQSARRLLREKLNGLRGALSADDTIAAMTESQRAAHLQTIDELERAIERDLVG